MNCEDIMFKRSGRKRVYGDRVKVTFFLDETIHAGIENAGRAIGLNLTESLHCCLVLGLPLFEAHPELSPALQNKFKRETTEEIDGE